MCQCRAWSWMHPASVASISASFLRRRFFVFQTELSTTAEKSRAMKKTKRSPEDEKKPAWGAVHLAEESRSVGSAQKGSDRVARQAETETREAAGQVSLPFVVVRAAAITPGIKSKGSIDDVDDPADFIARAKQLAEAGLLQPAKGFFRRPVRTTGLSACQGKQPQTFLPNRTRNRPLGQSI